MKLRQICVHRVLPIGVAVLMAAGCLTSCRGSGAGSDGETVTTATTAVTTTTAQGEDVTFYMEIGKVDGATTTTAKPTTTKIVTVTKADGTVETKIVTEATAKTTGSSVANGSTTKTSAKPTTVSSKATTKTTAAPVVTTTKATTKAATAAPTTKATAAPTTKAPTTTKKVTTTTTKVTTTTTTAIPTKCLNPGIWIESSTLDGGGVGPGFYLSCGKCAYCVSTRITPAEMEAWANAYLESLGMVIDYSDEYLPEVAAFLPPEKWNYENDATVDLKEQVKQYIHLTIEWRELPKGTPVRCVVREVDKFDCDYWIYILH